MLYIKSYYVILIFFLYLFLAELAAMLVLVTCLA